MKKNYKSRLTQFWELGDAQNHVLVSSTKSMIGHLLGAAGGIEFITCVKSIEDDNIMKNAVKATLTNPVQSIFMAKFALAVKEASKKRFDLEKKGEHIPAFLIASITSSCNLHCAGCYARAVHSCADTVPVEQLSAEEWNHIFEEAEEMGISFILLAGANR